MTMSNGKISFVGDDVLDLVGLAEGLGGRLFVLLHDEGVGVDGVSCLLCLAQRSLFLRLLGPFHLSFSLLLPPVLGHHQDLFLDALGELVQLHVLLLLGLFFDELASGLFEFGLEVGWLNGIDVHPILVNED